MNFTFLSLFFSFVQNVRPLFLPASVKLTSLKEHFFLKFHQKHQTDRDQFSKPPGNGRGEGEQGALRGAEERWGSGWVQGVTTTRVWCSANKVGSTLIARVLKNKNCPRQESYLRPTHDQKSKKKLCSEHVVGRTRTYASNEIR